VLIGYLRVGPDDDTHAAAQRQALAEAGCEQVMEDRPSQGFRTKNSVTMVCLRGVT